MSVKVKYPNGFVGFVSEKAAAIIAKKKDHKIVGKVKTDEEESKKPDEKKPEGDK